MDTSTNGAPAPDDSSASSAGDVALTLPEAVRSLTRRRDAAAADGRQEARSGARRRERTRPGATGKAAADEESNSPRTPSAAEAEFSNTPLDDVDVVGAELSEDPAPAADEPVAETAGSGEQPGLPPLDPPLAWATDEKAGFKALPRAVQESILRRESARDAELRRGHDEVAEARKELVAEREAALAVRRKYEEALPQVLQVLEAQKANEFADIKTIDDVRRLAEQDPGRFAKYQAAQMHIAAMAEERRAADERREQERAGRFNAWAGQQDASFATQFRELADPEKGPKLRASIEHYLTEVAGVPREQLPELRTMPVFRDARMQRIVYDAARFHAAQEKARAALAAPKPPVQRPGTARTPSGEANIQALEQKFADATSTREQIAAAAALRAAKRAAT